MNGLKGNIRKGKRSISFHVAGPQKSGTTLLVTLLNQHPGIYCLIDTSIYNEFFYWMIYVFYLDYHTSSRTRGSQYYDGKVLREDVLYLQPTAEEMNWFLSSLLVRYYSGTVQRLAALLKKKAGEKDFLYAEESLPYEYGKMIDQAEVLKKARKEEYRWIDLLESLMMSLVPDKAVGPGTKIGEKTPGHIRYLNYIRSEKNIVVVRNPLSNLSSYYLRLHAGTGSLTTKNNLENCMKVYDRFCLQRVMQNSDRIPSVLFVRFEDLLEDGRGTCRRIFDYLGLEPFEVSERFNPGVKGVYVGDRVDPARAGRGRNCFDAWQKSLIRKRYQAIFEIFYPNEL